ncbi:uncharacterized protein [Haliotis asinina]|uniref:uncharacterized protein n=1 Tax=Haliotis asinina TaxID=109174 RepID=UPI003531C28D
MASVPPSSQEDSSHGNLAGQPQQPNERSSISSQNQCVSEVSENGNSLTDETNQSPDDSTLTPTIQAQRVPVAAHTVRDATQPNGHADAKETYNRFFEEYYPNYKERVYRVPPVHISRLNSKQTKSKQTESLQEYTGFPFHVYTRSESHTIGDTAEARVSDSIEYLLNHWVPENHPAFIITSFQFENFCNQTGNPPQSDENRYTNNYTGENDAAVAAEKIISGEHDILIVHYKVGMIAIQVKVCKSHSDPNASVKEAIKQLERDKDFIKANFEDPDTGVSFKAIVALPSISLGELTQKTHKNACKRIHNYNNCKTYSHDCQQECLQRCLLDDNLPSKDCETETENGCKKNKLCEWWKSITKDSIGFKSLDDYKRVVARYIGFKSTVQIRDLSESVTEIGNRCMNIVLTPQQITVLESTLKRLVIQGDYGSGKTVLLILKARILLRQSNKNRLCIISMGHSPLTPVLEESIKFDMNPALFQGHGQDPIRIKFHQYVNQSELKQILAESTEENRHVLIDEFPSYVDMDDELKHLIKDFPSDLSFWCIMSREREACLTKGLQDSFPSFERVFMGKVLRCPPSVTKHLPTRPRNDHTILRYPKNKEIESTINNKKMTEHLIQLGLQTNRKEVCTVSPKQWIAWSDIVAIVDKNHKHREHCYVFLDKLGIPLTTLTDVNAFIKENAVLFVSEPESPGFVRREVIYFEPDKIVANPKMCEFQGGPQTKHINHKGHAAGELQQCQECETEFKSMIIELGLKPPQLNEQIVTQQHTTLEPSSLSKYTNVQAGAAGMSQNLLEQAKNPTHKLTYSDMVILDDRHDPECPTELFSKCLAVPVVDKLGENQLLDEDAFGSDTQVLYMKPRLFQGLERKIVIIITSDDPPIRSPLQDNNIVDYVELAVTRCSSQLIVVHT